MKRLSMTMVLPLCLLAACSDGPTKEESVKIFAAASTAMSSAQSRAVADARTSALAPVDQLDLDFSGPCSLGGTARVTGSYEGDGTDDRAAFDLSTTFTGCRELTGTLDGDLHWTSVADANGFTATMTGGLDWHGSDGDASCTFDLSLQVSEAGIVYGGSLCGYDVAAELHIGS